MTWYININSAHIGNQWPTEVNADKFWVVTNHQFWSVMTAKTASMSRRERVRKRNHLKHTLLGTGFFLFRELNTPSLSVRLLLLLLRAHNKKCPCFQRRAVGKIDHSKGTGVCGSLTHFKPNEDLCYFLEEKSRCEKENRRVWTSVYICFRGD